MAYPDILESAVTAPVGSEVCMLPADILELEKTLRSLSRSNSQSQSQHKRSASHSKDGSSKKSASPSPKKTSPTVINGDKIDFVGFIVLLCTLAMRGFPNVRVDERVPALFEWISTYSTAHIHDHHKH
jgi:hypothetical protein